MVPVVPVKAKLKISDAAVGAPKEVLNPFTLPRVMPGVIPQTAQMACDSATTAQYAFAWQQGIVTEGLQAFGYSYLAELAQRSEYRRPAEIFAKELTRKWIKLRSVGDDSGDKSEIIAQINAELERLDARAKFREALEQDGFFGRSQIFLDTGVEGDELKSPLVESKQKIRKGSLKRLVVIEPMWTYPNVYNSTNPLKPDYFKPQEWYVMGQGIHASRLLTIVSREVPDILKPAYSFGGLSLIQMGKPYVDNWLRTRQSVSDLINNFSKNGLKTNMNTVLNDGNADDLVRRVALMNRLSSNNGTMVLDKDTEEFFNVSVPLGSLDHLQAQAQEHMAAVFGIPLVILLGITPTGLNASSDGEIRAFYDWVHAQQEAVIAPKLTKLINLIQLSLFGGVDEDIKFEFEPLWQMDGEALARVRKSDAEAGVAYIDAGVISTEEERARLADDPQSGYNGLDPADLPEPPIEPAPPELGEGEDDPDPPQIA